ncbi:MAG: Ni/Fe-hydrogenase cytochrome b subunit [Calditrichaeota bacterium]|nr:MAG: Ni/Fe-hydrogenase cytochrome b subunit [Calditrichota bacterium]MBL1205162.1 Ni/Fe-hydrogenase cytochrome b subunit [Calditrichota bacterium]NOG44992.1 Ni/Fe-hydrogenase cytochrome b subunit [Calditrichota bacterium]
MEAFLKATQIKTRFFTPGVVVLTLLMINGLVFAALRFIFGIGSITNLNNQYPWGIWIGIDVAAGVALAAGGFTTAALVHIFHKEEFHDIVRPALLTAMLGYTFVGLGVFFDLGRYYFIYHPLYMWNGNSVLFEVGICVMAYISVLYIEFLPIITERFIGKVHLKGFLKIFNKATDSLLRLLDRIMDKAIFFFLILGVVLSCLHQSSIGTLMMIAGDKIHPLWQSPIAPLMYLISAFSVGFPMVIMESLISSRSFGLKPEINVLAKLGRFVGPMLFIYLAFKLGDMAIRETYVYLNELNVASVMWVIEVLIGIILPLRLFLWDKVLKSPFWIFVASNLVIFGVFINRFNNFIVAYTPLYAKESYWPSIGEISVTLGFISLEILLYRLIVMIFPVVSQPVQKITKKTRFALKGVIK